MRCAGFGRMVYKNPAERAALAAATAAKAHTAPADVILHGGHIAGPGTSLAQAIAIGQGRVQAIGGLDDVMARKGRMTRVIDLAGRAVLPGFIGLNFIREPLPFPGEPDSTGTAASEACLKSWSQAARLGYTTIRDAQFGSYAGQAEVDLLAALISQRALVRVQALAGRNVLDGLDPAAARASCDGRLHVLGNSLDAATPDFCGRPPDCSETIAALHSQGWQIELRARTAAEADGAITCYTQALQRSRASTHRHLLRSQTALTRQQELALMALGVSKTLDQACFHPDDATETAAAQKPLHFLASRVAQCGNGQSPRLALISALADLTINAAWQCHCEHLTGSLEPGKHADMVILAASPFDVDPGEIASLPIVQTWLQGIPVLP